MQAKYGRQARPLGGAVSSDGTLKLKTNFPLTSMKLPMHFSFLQHYRLSRLSRWWTWWPAKSTYLKGVKNLSLGWVFFLLVVSLGECRCLNRCLQQPVETTVTQSSIYTRIHVNPGSVLIACRFALQTLLSCLLSCKAASFADGNLTCLSC